jgi:hypothetical protein
VIGVFILMTMGDLHGAKKGKLSADGNHIINGTTAVQQAPAALLAQVAPVTTVPVEAQMQPTEAQQEVLPAEHVEVTQPEQRMLEAEPLQQEPAVYSTAQPAQQ